MQMTEELAAERVAAGIEALNDYDPEWLKLVDLDTFLIDSVLSCVLGQVFGSYNRGLEKLGLYSEERNRGLSFGFDVGPDDYTSEEGPGEAFRILQGVWEREIGALKSV